MFIKLKNIFSFVILFTSLFLFACQKETKDKDLIRLKENVLSVSFDSFTTRSVVNQEAENKLTSCYYGLYKDGVLIRSGYENLTLLSNFNIPVFSTGNYNLYVLANIDNIENLFPKQETNLADLRIQISDFENMNTTGLYMVGSSLNIPVVLNEQVNNVSIQLKRLFTKLQLDFSNTNPRFKDVSQVTIRNFQLKNGQVNETILPFSQKSYNGNYIVSDKIENEVFQKTDKPCLYVPFSNIDKNNFLSLSATFTLFGKEIDVNLPVNYDSELVQQNQIRKINFFDLVSKRIDLTSDIRNLSSNIQTIDIPANINSYNLVDNIIITENHISVLDTKTVNWDECTVYLVANPSGRLSLDGKTLQIRQSIDDLEGTTGKIKVVYKGFNKYIDINILPAVVERIVAIPNEVSIKQGISSEINVIAYYNNSFSKDVTFDIQYKIINSAGNRIEVWPVDWRKSYVIASRNIGYTGGTGTVRVTYNGKTADITVNLIPNTPPAKVVSRIEVTPTTMSLTSNGSATYRVMAYYTDSYYQAEDVTSSATVSVTNNANNRITATTGTVRATDVGYTGGTGTVRVTYNGKTADITVNLIPNTPPAKEFDCYELVINNQKGNTKDNDRRPDITCSSNTTLNYRIYKKYTNSYYPAEDVTNEFRFKDFGGNYPIATGLVTFPNSGEVHIGQVGYEYQIGDSMKYGYIIFTNGTYEVKFYLRALADPDNLSSLKVVIDKTKLSTNGSATITSVKAVYESGKEEEVIFDPKLNITLTDNAGGLVTLIDKTITAGNITSNTTAKIKIVYKNITVTWTIHLVQDIDIEEDWDNVIGDWN